MYDIESCSYSSYKEKESTEDITPENMKKARIASFNKRLDAEISKERWKKEQYNKSVERNFEDYLRDIKKAVEAGDRTIEICLGRYIILEGDCSREDFYDSYYKDTCHLLKKRGFVTKVKNKLIIDARFKKGLDKYKQYEQLLTIYCY